LQDSPQDAATTRYDDSDVVAADAVARMAGRHVLLLTDFDGTLAELAPRPTDAFASEHVRTALESVGSVGARPDVTLGIVSGRRMDDVAARVGIAAPYVAGLHGLEIRGRGEDFVHRALDEVEPVIAQLAVSAAEQLAWCPGCFLENKRWALTCHVRQSPTAAGERALEEFESLAEPYLESRVLRLLIGAKAIELLPAADWHKGRAVQWIRTRVIRDTGRAVSVLYLGDDRTDEDAFTALSVDDFAIGVGHRPHSHMIDARLDGPKAVGRFFTALFRQFEQDRE
jgi:alpha,alpha-trehalase